MAAILNSICEILIKALHAILSDVCLMAPVTIFSRGVFKTKARSEMRHPIDGLQKPPCEREQPAIKPRLRGWLPAICASTIMVLLGSIAQPVRAESPEISNRRSLERTEFTDREIVDGFFKVAFGAELQLGRRIERIRKFDEPVRIFVDNLGDPDRRAELANVATDIRARVNHIDLTLTEHAQAANVIVTLVRQRDLKHTIRRIFGRDHANQIQHSLDPQCLSGFGKDRRYRIRRAEVILPVDAGEFTFYDCAYEELLQALGPINDDSSVPWTMFNDEVQMGFFDTYDQYLLNILYDPRVRPGMSKEEVGKVLPEVLPTVRAWVAKANSVRDAQLLGRKRTD
jgi:hypothetical protein